MVAIRIIDSSFIYQKLLLNFYQAIFDFAFCSYTQIKNGDKEKRKATKKIWSWELSYSNAAPAPAPPEFKWNLQLRQKLTAPGLRLRHPGLEGALV